LLLHPQVVPTLSTGSSFSTSTSTRAKNILLRICNSLLRRLSKLDNCSFAGKIKIFLANVIPITDKSGLSSRSEHGISSSIQDPEESETSKAPSDASIASITDENYCYSFSITSTDPIQFSRRLSSLEKFFQAPLRVLSSSQQWESYVESVEDVLAVFSNNPIENNPINSSNFTDSNGIEIEPKTSQPLSSFRYAFHKIANDLQIQDSNFQRHVLLQLLIMHHTLLHSTRSLQQSQQTVGVLPNVNLSLTDAQIQTIGEHTRRAKIQLERTTPNGVQFLSLVNNILDRENNWLFWKRDSYKSFERIPLIKQSLKKQNLKGVDYVTDSVAISSKRMRMGTRELNRLWNLSSPLSTSNGLPQEESTTEDSLRERFTAPSLQEYLKPCAEQIADPNLVEEEYKLKNSKVYSWKALRLTAKHKFYYFSKLMSAVNVEGIVELLDSEKKGRKPEDSELASEDVSLSSASRVTPNSVTSEKILENLAENTDHRYQGELLPIISSADQKQDEMIVNSNESPNNTNKNSEESERRDEDIGKNRSNHGESDALLPNTTSSSENNPPSTVDEERSAIQSVSQTSSSPQSSRKRKSPSPTVDTTQKSTKRKETKSE